MIFRRLPKAASFERIHARMLSQWLVHADGRQAVIAFTSRIPGEGVSTTVAGLACAFGAADPGGVLVLDAAHGRRRVAHYLHTMAEPGVLDASEPEKTDFPSMTTHVESAGIDLLTLAPDGGRATVETNHARKALNVLKLRYRTVLIDAGALSDSASASWLACGDYRVLVVDVSQATQEVLAYQAKQLEFSGIRLDGSVLNKRLHYIPRFLYWLAR